MIVMNGMLGRQCLSAQRFAQALRALVPVSRTSSTLTGFRDMGNSLRAQFNRDGFCVVPGVLSADEIERTKTQGETEVCLEVPCFLPFAL